MASNGSERSGAAAAAEQWVSASQDAIAGVEEQIAEIDERTRSFVREHPMASLALAVATGFVVGRIASRL